MKLELNDQLNLKFKYLFILKLMYFAFYLFIKLNHKMIINKLYKMLAKPRIYELITN